jgi:hypothetical protein
MAQASEMPFSAPTLMFFKRGEIFPRQCVHHRASIVGTHRRRLLMCRNIRNLYNFKPPATEEEIRASSLQFVRKLSGFNRPSKANEEVFNRAVDAVAGAARELIASLVTTAPPRDREVEAMKARERSAARFGRTAGGAA